MQSSLMIQGTMSGVGKSLIAAAFCRIFHRSGYSVAPFKSQNMSLNSFVTEDGLEMGRAQVVQAYAACEKPDARMNPILLKPNSDRKSQLILHGKPHGSYSAREYQTLKAELIPEILKDYELLKQNHDIIVIEGAGGAAEINLREYDIVNMGFAELVDAPVLLVGDIDRGGVFAQLAGTVSIISESDRARIKGFIINKFRGDKSILTPGLSQIEELTGIPVLGVIPYADISIDDEDSLSSRFNKNNTVKPVDIAVIRLPRISNFTDLNVFDRFDMVSLRYIKKPDEFLNPDLIIIPGTKSTLSDLNWLKSTGFDRIIYKAAERGTPVIGICGGFQMLGRRISDPFGVESGSAETTDGLGLLDTETVFERDKTTRQVSGTISGLGGSLRSLNGARYTGYEIHMGVTHGMGSKIMQSGEVYGTYVHGIFDNVEIAERLIQALAERKGLEIKLNAEQRETDAEDKYDALANLVQENVDWERVYG